MKFAWLLSMAVLYSSPAMANDVRWTKVDDNIFIDESTKKDAGFEKTAIDVLVNYNEISSAQMWGLSEVDSVVWDCRNSRYFGRKTVWHDGHMAMGPITKVFGPDRKPQPIPMSFIRVFAKLCAIGPEPLLSSTELQICKKFDEGDNLQFTGYLVATDEKREEPELDSKPYDFVFLDKPICFVKDADQPITTIEVYPAKEELLGRHIFATGKMVAGPSWSAEISGMSFKSEK